MFLYAGKTAVIIGAGNAIGREIAKACAARGMKLVLADDISLDELKAEVQAMGVPAIAVCTNPANYEDIVRLKETAVENFGTVDLVFNNADAPACGQIEETTVEQFDYAMRRRIYGLFYSYKTFLPFMWQQGTRGHIVTTTSVEGFYGAPGDPVFAMLSHGIFGLSEPIQFNMVGYGQNMGMTFMCVARDKDGKEDDPAEIVKATFDAIEEERDYAATPLGKELVKQVFNETEMMADRIGRPDLQAWFGMTPAPSKWDGSKDYRGQTAVVTGAARGIGFAICQHCAQRGMNVVMADIDMEQLKKSELEIQKMGAQTLAQYCDVTRYECLQELAQVTLDKFGTVEMLFNNAGVTVLGGLSDLPLRDFEFGIQTNVYSVFYGLKAFLPIMRKQGNACHIGVTASLAAIATEPGMPTYQCGKHAVLGLCEAVYYDMILRGDNIGMSVLCPGMVNTNIDTCDARRPARFMDENDPYYKTEGYLSGRRMSTQNIAGGATPERTAELLMKKVEKREFFALPNYRPEEGRDLHNITRQKERAEAVMGLREHGTDWDWVREIVDGWRGK